MLWHNDGSRPDLVGGGTVRAPTARVSGVERTLEHGRVGASLAADLARLDLAWLDQAMAHAGLDGIWRQHASSRLHKLVERMAELPVCREYSSRSV